MLSERWYRDNMPPFKAALEDGTLDGLPADKDTIDDYRALKVIKGVPRVPDSRTSENGGGKRHGDAAVAGVLAYAASRMEVEAYGYEPVGRGRNDNRSFDDDAPPSGWGAGGLW
ncbi:hypothetical protein D3C78_1683600 [compost metagenome]